MKLFKRLLFILFLLLLIFIIPHILPKIEFNSPYSYALYSSNGKLLDAMVAQDGQWRIPMIQNEMPHKVIIALLLLEDKRYYYHKGVDYASLIRALYQNIKHHKVISGGSTISMQVARLYYKNNHRTLTQKIKEILLAWYMEFTMSKEEILKLYLQNAPFGGNIVGIETAAWKYFGCSASSLSWAESTMLATIPNNPANIHPSKNKQKLKIKRNRLLKLLYDVHVIDKQTYELSIEEDIPEVSLDFPHQTPHLLQYLIKKYPNQTLFKTSIEENIQVSIYEILERYKDEYKANNIKNVALMVYRLKDGKVIAYVGNYKEQSNQNNAHYVNIIESKRSGGSILKPFLYATMLNEGELLPDMLIPDVPIQIGNFAPKNFNRGYDGAVRAHTALARSLNVPSVKMLQWYGIQRFIDNLKELGFTTINRSQDYYGLSLILGGCEIKMSELVMAYAKMAWKLTHKSNDNFRFSYLIDEIEDNQDNTLLSKASCWLTFNAMLDVERPENERYWYFFDTKQKIAWKTGTSFAFRDAWAVGVTPEYVVAVWVGNATGEGSAELTGIKKAAPILFEVFSILPYTNKWFATPYDDLQLIETCRQSGYPASIWCTDKVKSLAPKTSIKVKVCPYHREFFLDSSATYRVHSDCESVHNMVKKVFFVLPPTMEFYYRKHNAWYKTLPAYRNDCEQSHIESKQNIDFVYPQQYTNVIIPRNLDGTYSSTLFEVSHRFVSTIVYWYLDGKFIGQTQNKHQMPIATTMGKHTITVQDEYGETKQIEFNVVNEP
ncbi:MAG: penicillin-binding protein 1C [Bacteroidales bacterium]|nr:penicillin-binding protein 1C [Bacteroidales bacterium]